MNNKFTVIVLLGNEKRILDFKRTNKDSLMGENVITLTKVDSLKDQIDFIINDEALSKTKDVIVVELNEYYPETINEIVEEVHTLDINIKFMMVVDGENMTPNDQATYDRIAEILNVTDAQIEKAKYMSYSEPSVGEFKLPNNVFTNITNLNSLINSIRFYYGIEDKEDMSESQIPTEVKNLIESSYNLIAGRIIEDIKHINE